MPAAVALSVLEWVPVPDAPTDAPRVQLPTVAMPNVVVVGVAAVTLPPPVATEKVTVTPDFALPNASVIRTDGAVATVVPMRAV